MDVFEVADALVTHAVKHYGEAIDLIGYYGSYAQGKATEYSDLDVFYTPAEGQNPPINRTFLLEGREFDFWAISWKQLEEFAMGSSRGWSVAPALVYHTHLLYARSEEQVARLTKIQQSIRDLQSPEARPQMLKRALERYAFVWNDVGRVRLAVLSNDLANVRHAAWSVVASVCECLALINQTFLNRGYSNLREEVAQFTLRPKEIEKRLEVIATSSDLETVANMAEQLALETRQILLHQQKTLVSQEDAHTVFESVYPELRGMLDKVRSACKRNDPVGASTAVWAIQTEIAQMLSSLQPGKGDATFHLYSEVSEYYRALNFPDVLSLDFGDLAEAAQGIERLDSVLRAWLEEQAISLQEFSSLEALRLTLSAT